ncbi:MAG TPA: glycosyltransferase family 4 protein [Verrucomicrobiae bacterium]|jgi:glycosyltransferase involved in cell wall biosynthesis
MEILGEKALKLKIAQVAPLYESVPPQFYGGTERVVSYLTEALVDLGHEVTLYASGDSSTKANLRPICKRALRLDKTSVDPHADHVFMAERIFREAGEFDIVHSHIDYSFFPLLRRMQTAHLTTLHGRLDIPNLRDLYREFADMPVASISHRQRAPLPWADWQTTVYHGVPEKMFKPVATAGKYLAFLGRISPEKRVDEAIQAANRVGMPLKIAAKVDKVDVEYYQAVVKPLLNRNVEFVGEIRDSDKNEFLGNAAALLFMIDWPEPFGLAMIEALACGTPVIARNRGSVPEIIEQGVTGYIVKNVDEAVEAIPEISRLNRKRCREAFEQRFTATRMANDYINVYEKLILAQIAPKIAAAL